MGGEIFEELERRVLPAFRRNLVAARLDVEACIELQIANDAPDLPREVHHLVVTGGRATLHPGPCVRPSIIVKCHADDGLALLEGVLDVRAALTDGRLALSGDVVLAMKLGPLFSV